MLVLGVEVIPRIFSDRAENSLAVSACNRKVTDFVNSIPPSSEKRSNVNHVPLRQHYMSMLDEDRKMYGILLWMCR